MNKFIKRRFSLIALTFSMTAFHAHAAIEPADRLCDASVLNTPEVYRCEGFTEEVRVKVERRSLIKTSVRFSRRIGDSRSTLNAITRFSLCPIAHRIS